ncbi:MAG: hypothetical protein HF982_01420 [Desulfobacteraceae bacterium]|nr:hypothetical protein [Desulfobacteraceae bacterium]MBC2718257.1 hypothetical protein [Desulfobacteraceae bacterium]
MPVAKYAIAGANIKDRLWMIKHALSLKPTVNLVIYEVDARMFDTEGLSSASYSLFLPFADSAVMSQYLYDEATWQEFYTAKLIKTAGFRDQTLNSHAWIAESKRKQARYALNSIKVIWRGNGGERSGFLMRP